MAYKKLTKRQHKDRERILAWLNGEEFRKNSKSKPAVPDLSRGEVLEFYVPPDVTGAGQYFTPEEMSSYLIGCLDIPWYDGDGYSVLDPCAGIGHLLWPIADRDMKLTAYEIEEECVKVGQKLFPKIKWHWEIPFDHVDKLESRFDCVVLNPPFNTRRGMYPGEAMCEGRCSKSEHIFFELAVRACKPGGQIAVIAPYNFIDKFPKPFRAWLKDKAELTVDLGQLPGEFALGGIKVHGFIFRCLAVKELEPAKRDWRAEWDRGPILAGVPVRAQGMPLRQLSMF